MSQNVSVSSEHELDLSPFTGSNTLLPFLQASVKILLYNIIIVQDRKYLSTSLKRNFKTQWQ
jgi:hypothetical protein